MYFYKFLFVVIKFILKEFVNDFQNIFEFFLLNVCYIQKVMMNKENISLQIIIRKTPQHKIKEYSIF